MPVRFRCHGCQRVLSALDRKIGEEVNCPGCGSLLVVPENDTVPAPPSAPPLPADGRHQPSQTPSDSDAGGIRISRRVLYAQAVLIAVAAAGFFIAGLYVGRGTQDVPQTTELGGTIHVTGRVTFAPSAGDSQPAIGAAVLILPAQRKPRRDAKIDAAPLHPLEPLPPPSGDLLATVEALGGAYARTDEAGRFRASLPARGQYHLLVLARETRGGTGEINRVDLAVLGEYVTDAFALVDRQVYVLATEQLADGDTFEHAFQR
jgi:hypothetical protein